MVDDNGLRTGIEPEVGLAPEGLRWQLALRVVRSWAGRLEVEVQPATVAQYLRQLYDQMSDHLVQPEDLVEAHRRLRSQLIPPPGKAQVNDVRKIHDTAEL